MFLPIGTDRPLVRKPVVTLGVIGLLATIHVLREAADATGAQRAGASVTEALILGRGYLDAWRFLTYALLHGDWWHLAGNCLFLWVFGPNVEDRIGRVWFLAFLAAGAGIAGLAHVLSTPNPVIGASGAVSGATGAYFVLFPRTRIRTFVIFFIIGGVMVPAWFFIGLAVARDLLGQSLGMDTGVAHLAHLAGYAYGGLLSAVLLKLKVIQPEVYDLMTTLRQRSRRQAIRAASRAQQSTVSATEKPRRRSPGEQKAAEARSRVSTLVAGGSLEEALDTLEEARGAIDADDHAAWRALTPGRDALLRLAQHAVDGDRRDIAAWLYERFLETYPRDREASGVRIMAALLLIRDQGEPGRGARLLADGMDTFVGDELELAQQLLTEAGQDDPSERSDEHTKEGAA